MYELDRQVRLKTAHPRDLILTKLAELNAWF